MNTLTSPLQTRVEVNGVPTNLLYQQFSDKHLIIVTQYRKLGTLTLVSEDKALPGNPSTVKTYTSQVLLGEDTEVSQVIARAFASTVATDKPILVSAALKDKSKEMVNTIKTRLQHLLETAAME